jgi:Fe-S cluster biosynthesis and repair protein YggX
VARNSFLEKRWKNIHLEKIKKKAGPRYTPEFNVELPIAEIFDGITRNENFYFSIRQHCGKLIRAYKKVSPAYENNEIKALYQSLRKELNSLLKLLSKLTAYNTKPIAWGKISKKSIKGQELARNLSEKFRNEKTFLEQQKADTRNDPTSRSISERYGSDIHYLHNMQSELQYFEEFSQSPSAKLSNSPFLLLTGLAGSGKTHLLCDILGKRVNSKHLAPALLVFGEDFVSTETPLIQATHQLRLNLNTSTFLRLVNAKARKSGSRALIIIDALNETKQRNYWKRNLGKLVAQVGKYPNVALAISIRSGFEGEVLPPKAISLFVHEKHQGFKFREWEAVTTFFNSFSLPLPEIPLLMPEFQNPLFLLLFCKAFQKRSKRSKGQREIFRGHEGATYIFETYVDSVSRKISGQFGIQFGGGKNIWDTVIEKIAAKMVEQNTDVISEEEVNALAKKAHPTIDHNHFIKELERNLLLVKIPKFSIEKNQYNGFDFRFPFQRFSDHLLGRYIFKKYEKEFGTKNKNLETASRFFSKRRLLGKFISQEWNVGIIQALSIQCPEYLKGLEFVQVAPYLHNSYVAQDAFIESLIWRKPEAFSIDLKNTLNYINTTITKTKHGQSSLLNALLAIAPLPNHPFKADFLHGHLSKYPMSNRDSWWSTFLHYQYGNRESVDRLIEWGWAQTDKKHINDESIRLCSVALVWFLTTSNRFLRDKSTKALVALLTGRLKVVLALLNLFKTVDDPYVSERLYAVAYGCVLRSRTDKKGLKEIAEWIYANVFQNGSVPPHILLRDNARGVIEVALKEQLDLRINRKNIVPPYNSEWPKNIPSEKMLKMKYYTKDFSKIPRNPGFSDIWSSVMFELGDFGQYVLNPAVDHWTGRRLFGKEANRKLVFANFKSSLTREQKHLLDKATNPLIGVDISVFPQKIKVIYLSNLGTTSKKDLKSLEQEQKKGRKQGISIFENSLDPPKKQFFKKEIYPYFDSHGRIYEPLDNFDRGLAKRWVFSKVVQLGWKPELHGAFDRDVNSSMANRSGQKAERIGKKYQWIALHELLARLADNFQFKEESLRNKIGKYEGSWQLSVRDIDPSCILKEFPNFSPEGIPKFPGGSKRDIYNAWSKRALDSTWIKKQADLPDPRLVMEFTDASGNKWAALESFADWEQETLPEHERYDLPTRKLFYMMKGRGGPVFLNNCMVVDKWIAPG